MPIAQDDQDDPIPSHHPIKEKDPLPLLQLFTPLTMTHGVSPPTVSDSNSQEVLQQHIVKLASPGNLLTCQVKFTIASSAAAPEDAHISAVEAADVSPWASREIGKCLTERAAECDVALIGYGLGRYWDIATRRAQCWIRIAKSFPELIDLPGNDAGKENANPKDTAGKRLKDVFSRKELARHIGRSSLLLQSSNAHLLLSWKLSFDCTGEVQSSVSARAGFPDVWSEADDRGSLGKLPKVFDALVRERGVFEAVKIVGGILFRTAD